jgi:hypothetical protein
MSTTELVELGKAALLEAKMVVQTECGQAETYWVKQGKQIAWCLGVPAKCTNSPTREKYRCVHFSVSWGNVFGTERFYPEHYEDIEADEELETWVNQQPFTALECVSVGQYVTHGTWNHARNRWFWGPKQNRQ